MRTSGDENVELECGDDERRAAMCGCNSGREMGTGTVVLHDEIDTLRCGIGIGIDPLPLLPTVNVNGKLGAASHDGTRLPASLRCPLPKVASMPMNGVGIGVFSSSMTIRTVAGVVITVGGHPRNRFSRFTLSSSSGEAYRTTLAELLVVVLETKGACGHDDCAEASACC